MNFRLRKYKVINTFNWVGNLYHFLGMPVLNLLSSTQIWFYSVLAIPHPIVKATHTGHACSCIPWEAFTAVEDLIFPSLETLKDRIIAMFSFSRGTNIKSRFIVFISQKTKSAIFISYCQFFKVRKRGILEGRPMGKKNGSEVSSGERCYIGWHFRKWSNSWLSLS